MHESSTDLVDGNDQLGSLHSCEMLDRARDTDGEVQLRSDNLAGESRKQAKMIEGSALGARRGCSST